MRKYRLLALLIPTLLFSCTPKFYSKKDYSFYKENFRLEPGSLLRTDGIYKLTKIQTDENGGTVKAPENIVYYKFYPSGQSNTILDLSAKGNEVTIDSIVKQFAVTEKRTLFQGYYHLENNQLVIQRKVARRHLTEYIYGYVEKDQLILVKFTTGGKGKLREKYFTNYYRTYYTFIPAAGTNQSIPNW